MVMIMMFSGLYDWWLGDDKGNTQQLFMSCVHGVAGGNHNVNFRGTVTDLPTSFLWILSSCYLVPRYLTLPLSLLPCLHRNDLDYMAMQNISKIKKDEIGSTVKLYVGKQLYLKQCNPEIVCWKLVSTGNSRVPP